MNSARAVGTRLRPAVDLEALLDFRLQVLVASAVGFALRFWDLRGVPPGLNQDEAIYGYDAYSIFMTGRDHLGHPFPFASLETFGDWSSPLLTFLSIPAVALFGLHVEVLRGVSALVGVTAVPLMACLGIVLFRSTRIGLAAAWIIAVLPWAVYLSRWAIIPTVVPTMAAATLLVLVWSLQNGRARGIVAGAVLAGVTVASYHAMKLYMPVLLIAVAAVYWRELRRMRLEPLAYAGACFTFIAGPVLYLTLRDPGGGARLEQTSAFRDQAISLGLLAEQYFAYFSPRFWLVAGDGDPMHLPAGQGLVPYAMAPFLLAGLGAMCFWALRRPELRKGALLLLLAIALYPLPGMLTLPSPHVLRAAHVLPLLSLIAAVGLVATAEAFVAVASSRRALLGAGAALATVLAIAFSAELWSRYDHYFTRYADEVAAHFHYGIEDALAYAAAHESGYDEVWVDDTNAAYAYVLFFKRWEPSDVHRDLIVRRNPPDWNQAVSIGRYRFGAPPDFVAGETLHASIYRNGSTAYEVIEGRSGERSVLVVRPAR
jgi:4-amino-4-deoxy-L-arabinose transferase-like glycosyltransferase